MVNGFRKCGKIQQSQALCEGVSGSQGLPRSVHAILRVLHTHKLFSLIQKPFHILIALAVKNMTRHPGSCYILLLVLSGPPYNGILLSNEKEQSTDMHNTNDTQNQRAK